MITASESSLSSVVSDVPVSDVVVESTTSVVPADVVVTDTTTETVVAEKPAKAKKAAKKKATKAKVKKAAKKSSKKSSKKTAKKEKTIVAEPAAEVVVTETTPTVETALVEMVATETTPVVKAGPGRPHRYTGAVEQAIISLYNEVGTVLQTRNVLIAPNDSELSNQRNKSVIPDPLTISMPCLTSLLKRNGVSRRSPGRPKVVTTEVVAETAEPVMVSVEISETIDVVSTESQPVEVATENIEVATENVEVPATDIVAA